MELREHSLSLFRLVLLHAGTKAEMLPFPFEDYQPCVVGNFRGQGLSERSDHSRVQDIGFGLIQDEPERRSFKFLFDANQLSSPVSSCCFRV